MGNSTRGSCGDGVRKTRPPAITNAPLQPPRRGTVPVSSREATHRGPLPPQRFLLDQVRVELLVPRAVEGVGDVQPLAIHAELHLTGAAVHPLALKAQQTAVMLLASFLQQPSTSSRSAAEHGAAEPGGCLPAPPNAGKLPEAADARATALESFPRNPGQSTSTAEGQRTPAGKGDAELTFTTKGSGWHFSSSSLHTATGPPRRMLPPTNTCRPGRGRPGALSASHHQVLLRNPAGQALLLLPYLSHQPGLAGLAQLVLADVSVQPVAEIQVPVVLRDEQLDREGWGTETKSSREGSPSRQPALHPAQPASLPAILSVVPPAWESCPGALGAAPRVFSGLCTAPKPLQQAFRRAYPARLWGSASGLCQAAPRNAVGGERKRHLGAHQPGILGIIHPVTSLAGIRITSSTAQFSLCTGNTGAAP